MKTMIYPHDQSQVIFTDREGVRREGKYVLSMQAFVELSDNERPEDCSNTYPEANIVSWEYVENNDPEAGLIEVF